MNKALGLSFVDLPPISRAMFRLVSLAPDRAALPPPPKKKNYVNSTSDVLEYLYRIADEVSKFGCFPMRFSMSL